MQKQLYISLILILIVTIELIISSCGQELVPEETLAPTINASPSTTKAKLTPTIVPSPTFTETSIPSRHTPLPEAENLLEEAFSYSRQGEDEKAIETYTKAIEADPLFGQPYFNRGAIYADHRELEKALADFNKGLEVDPASPHGYSLRANVLFELGKLDEAMEDIKSILNLTKEDEYIKMALTSAGHVYNKQDEPFLAISAYTAALEIDEYFTPALISRGQIYLNQGDQLRAFADLVLALQLEEDPEFKQAINDILMNVYPEGTAPEDAATAAKVYYDQAMKHKDASDWQSSADALTKAIEIDPLNYEFYYQRALDLADLGDMEQAITDMSYVIALTPLIPGGQGYFFRGHFEYNFGMVSEAIADLEKALELEISSQLEAMAKQELDSLYNQLDTCQMTEFEVVNDAPKPTFMFTFKGPPNTDFMVLALNRVTGDGYIMEATTPRDGITPTGIEYELKKGEVAPIELDIKARAGDCRFSKIAVWPEIDVMAELSGERP